MGQGGPLRVRRTLQVGMRGDVSAACSPAVGVSYSRLRWRGRSDPAFSGSTSAGLPGNLTLSQSRKRRRAKKTMVPKTGPGKRKGAASMARLSAHATKRIKQHPIGT